MKWTAVGAFVALVVTAGATVGTQSPSDPPQLVKQYCVGCHNDRTRAGELTLAKFDVADPQHSAETAEKMIRKLRAGMMPPPGIRRPDEKALAGLADLLERQADARTTELVPGRRTFQRLNRAEYAQSIHDLLALDVNVGEYLPLDAKSANFDNIADAQLLSPTLMQGYLTAAAEISRLAVGDPAATARAWLPLGFREAGPGRVEVGGAFLEVHPGDGAVAERPLLNHLAVLVDLAARADVRHSGGVSLDRHRPGNAANRRRFLRPDSLVAPDRASGADDEQQRQ